MSRHKKAGLISSYNTVHLHRTCNSSSFSCWRKGHGVRSSRAQTWGVGFDPRHPCSPNASPSTCSATGLKKRCWWEEFYARTLFVHNCKIVTIPRRFRGARQHSVLVLFWPCDRVKMQQHYWNWMRGAPFLLRSCCSLSDFPGSFSRGNRIYWFPRRLFFSFLWNTGLHFVENCRKLTRKGHVDFPVGW